MLNRMMGHPNARGVNNDNAMLPLDIDTEMTEAEKQWLASHPGQDYPIAWIVRNGNNPHWMDKKTYQTCCSEIVQFVRTTLDTKIPERAHSMFTENRLGQYETSVHEGVTSSMIFGHCHGWQLTLGGAGKRSLGEYFRWIQAHGNQRQRDHMDAMLEIIQYVWKFGIDRNRRHFLSWPAVREKKYKGWVDSMKATGEKGRCGKPMWTLMYATECKLNSNDSGNGSGHYVPFVILAERVMFRVHLFDHIFACNSKAGNAVQNHFQHANERINNYRMEAVNTRFWM